MRRLVLLNVLLVVVLCGVNLGTSDAGEPHDTKPKSDRTVTLQVVDVPLNEVLSILAKNIPMEIRGAVPTQERITVNFSHLTLEEALSRIMRGYNYVLVRADDSAKPLLVVMNRIDRNIQAEPASLAPAAVGPSPPVGAVATQTGPARPGVQQIPPGQGQEAPPPVVGPPGSGQAGLQRPESQPILPGSIPGGMPMPPGAASGSGAPSSMPGGAPPTPFNPPGAMNPPPQGAAPGAPQSIPPAQPQQPAQPTPEPARIMTPFGDRSAEQSHTGP
ncbi:MAG TPA: hypothetical protein VKF36_06375 [Syntrophorhabdales bacterium]|nr:hypothetical protein [Syntrophorhabdales bacterium]